MEKKSLYKSCSQLELQTNNQALLVAYRPYPSVASAHSYSTTAVQRAISEGQLLKTSTKSSPEFSFAYHTRTPDIEVSVKAKANGLSAMTSSEDYFDGSTYSYSELPHQENETPRRCSELSIVGLTTPTEKQQTAKVSVQESIICSSSLGVVTSVASETASDLLQRVSEGETSRLNELFVDYDFDFENLIFEGGGNKGMAYVGALEVLEDVGIMKKIKRLAGSSAGAIIASLVAIGFDSDDLRNFLDQDLRRVFVDHKCGYLSLIPNLLKGYGWNPGKNALKWFGEQLKDATGNPDITFKQVHEQFGKELCIVVTNLNQMSVEYFHPKTTPNTPIRRAVRMSMALPGVFQCVKEVNNDCVDLYVDGGLLCNYPIHSYDGWWLSMDKDDAFFKRLQSLENIAKLMEKNNRFGVWNTKTIGIMLYSHSETELMKTLLSEREGNTPPQHPPTKLAKSRAHLKENKEKMKKSHQAMMSAAGRFMNELQRNNLDRDSVITRQEFQGVFRKPEDILPRDIEMLFGNNVTCDEAFDMIDCDGDEEISFQELMGFIEKSGVQLQTRFLGYHRREIRHLGDFIATLQAALSVNVKKVFVEERDVDRTIGIDTDYIETTDFNLEPRDKTFLVECGVRAARAFLKEYTNKQRVNNTTSQQKQANGQIKQSSENACL